ncbi:MAG: amidohydrolase family protein [Magnetovibrio sp.]|nr:amidohydrolase family protein [Magnetovibrio sp.]
MSVLIRNARVIDGTGAPAEACLDVRVDGDEITAVGAGLDAGGASVVDADGLALMPGIVDTHTHYDAQITWDADLTPSPALGVTTAVIGNCGFTIAPCREADRDLVMRNLTQVEGMSIEVLRGGIRWDFETVPEYLDMIAAGRTRINVAAFVGHSAVRTYVMKDAAVERAANDDEIAEMRRIVADAMAAGAIGFSTSTAPQHNGDGGVPMPSRLADDRELAALVGAMAESGRGVFMLTKGNRTDVPYLEELAAAAGRPVMIAALLHNSTNPTGTFDELEQIAAARARGRELWGQVSCCPLTMDFTIASAYPFESLKAWAPAMKTGRDALPGLLADSAFRDAVKAELAEPAGVRLFNGEWEKLEIVEVARAANAAVEGRTIAELAAEAGAQPLDWMLDFAIGEGLETVFTAVLLNSDVDAVGRMIRDPNASVALSDAGAHLTFFCDAGFGLHLMGHWSRDLGVLPLEAAVRELTAKPAEIFRIPGRGRVAPGYKADLLLFDPDTVGRGPKRRVFDLPGGAPRLTTDAVGVEGVWVNGRQIADAGEALDGAPMPGRLLRYFNP